MVVGKALVGLAVGAAGLAVAFAAPAAAAPVTFGCSPCVAAPNADPPTGAPWTDFFNAFAPWEKITDPAGNGQGIWENGVQAVNGGVWEKVFPPAP